MTDSLDELNAGVIFTSDESQFGNFEIELLKRCFGQQSPVKNKTRGPPIEKARRNAAPLNLKISADILRVISGDLASNRG